MFNPNDPYGLGIFGPPVEQQRRPVKDYLPEVSDAQADDYLGEAMEGSLGGLAYLGKVLDKTFGGRAIRGVLGGRPEEILSILPGSDSLGLTQERNTVYGRELLDKYGLSSGKDDPNTFEWDDALGIGAEILLDPATYTGVGLVRRGVAGAAKSGLAQGAKAKAGRVVNWARDKPVLGAAISRGEKVGDGVWRSGRRLFDPVVRGLGTGYGQKLAAAKGTPLQRELEAKYGQMYAENIEALSPYLNHADSRVAEVALRQARMAGEDAVLTPHLQAQTKELLDAGVIQGRDVAVFLRTGRAMGGQSKAMIADQLARGQPSQQLKDVLPDYSQKSKEVRKVLGEPERTLGHLPRDKDFIEHIAGEGVLGRISRAARDLAVGDSSQVARKKMYTGVRGGTNLIDEIVAGRYYDELGEAIPMDVVKNFTPLEEQAAIRRSLTMMGGDTTKLGVQQKAKQLAAKVRNQPKEYRELGRGEYSPDLVESLRKRGKASATMQTNAELIYHALSDKSIVQKLGASDDLMPLEDVLKASGLQGTFAGAQKSTVKHLAGKLGINPNDVSKYGIPKDIGRDMARLGEAWTNPKAMGPVLATWDAMNNLFKTGVTTIFPAFHTRNLGSMIFNMWRSGEGTMGAIDLKAMGSSYKLLRGDMQAFDAMPGMTAQAGDKAGATRELIRELITHEVAFTPRATAGRDLVGAGSQAQITQPGVRPASGNGVIEDMIDWGKRALPKSRADLNPLGMQGVAGKQDTNSLVKAGHELGDNLENWGRTSHYVALRKQGMAPAEAAIEVKKYQLDYSNLSDFERNVMRRIIPWYCVPTDHEILTRRGWKTYDQLVEGEDILGYDHETGSHQWEPLQAINLFPYDGELMTFKGRSLDFEFTDNHRWPIISDRTLTKGKWYGDDRRMCEAHAIKTNQRGAANRRLSGCRFHSLATPCGDPRPACHRRVASLAWQSLPRW